MTKKYKPANSFKVFINIILVSIIIMINIWLSLSWADSKNTFNELSVVINGCKILNNKIYFSYVDNIAEGKINELSNKEILDIILSHPYVQAARTSNRYPSKIIVDIKEREPFAILNRDPIIILDQYCFVLPNSNNLDQYDIPILSKFNNDQKLYPEGEKSLSTKVQNTISWLSSLNDKHPTFYSNISEVFLENDDEIVLILNEYPTKIFLGKNNTLKKIEILKNFEQTIKEAKKITDYAYLDIRYDNQVIAKEN
tara:strand:+ start:80 stop:844 length:765 start_codon:yes stop_codon:yes gene_type:complete